METSSPPESKRASDETESASSHQKRHKTDDTSDTNQGGITRPHDVCPKDDQELDAEIEKHLNSDPPPITEEYDHAAWKEFREANPQNFGTASYFMTFYLATIRSCPENLAINFSSFWGEETYTLGCDEPIEDVLKQYLETRADNKHKLLPKDVVVSTNSYLEESETIRYKPQALSRPFSPKSIPETTPRKLFTGAEPPLVLHVMLANKDRHESLREIHHNQVNLPPDYIQLRGSAYMVSPNDPSYIIGPKAIEVANQVGAAVNLYEGTDTGRGWFQMVEALQEIVMQIPSFTKEQVTALILAMYRWEEWRMDARGKIMFHREKCRLATKVLINSLADAVYTLVVSSSPSCTSTELGSTKHQFERALQEISPKWDDCFEKTLQLLRTNDPTSLEAASCSEAAALPLDDMVAEARTWVIGNPSDDSIRTLLSSLVLTSMETRTREVTDDHVAEELKLRFTLLTKSSYCDKKAAPTRSFSYFWNAVWYDCDHAGLAGTIMCHPFVEDPPVMNTKRPYPCEPEVLEKFREQHNLAASVIRPHWNLKRIHGLRKECMDWRRGAGIKTKDIGWEDVARCVCAGVGVVARDHKNNQGEWILKRLMLRLERELRTFNNKDAPDPNVMEWSQKLHLYGGCLNSQESLDALIKESRWDRKKV